MQAKTSRAKPTKPSIRTAPVRKRPAKPSVRAAPVDLRRNSRSVNQTRTRAAAIALCCLAGGCGLQPSVDTPRGTDVLVSVINVTPFAVEAILSGVLDDSVDTVRPLVDPSDSSDTSFVCLDQLVVGDPIDPALPGITIQTEGEPETIAAFSILQGESFACGDIIEIIVSGIDADSFAVDVFALTPP